MSITIGTQILAAIVFGLVVRGVFVLIAGSAWNWREYLAWAFAWACFAFIILFGPITL
jgi:predicted cobalt transporter CbtA